MGARPLHVAAANGYLSVVEFLLDQHVATDAKDQDGWQPIHAAACWGHVRSTRFYFRISSYLQSIPSLAGGCGNAGSKWL